jgi:exonuclease V gamma subunit
MSNFPMPFYPYYNIYGYSANPYNLFYQQTLNYPNYHQNAQILTNSPFYSNPQIIPSNAQINPAQTHYIYPNPID